MRIINNQFLLIQFPIFILTIILCLIFGYEYFIALILTSFVMLISLFFSFKIVYIQNDTIYFYYILWFKNKKVRVDERIYFYLKNDAKGKHLFLNDGNKEIEVKYWISEKESKKVFEFLSKNKISYNYSAPLDL
jgi:hypothetical protein